MGGEKERKKEEEKDNDNNSNNKKDSQTALQVYKQLSVHNLPIHTSAAGDTPK